MITHTMIMRCEESPSERRAPLTPEDAGRLLGAGFRILVETSAHRIFSDEQYRNSGCEIVSKESWRSAPSKTTILGIKALPEDEMCFSHIHIFFAHAYRKQLHSVSLLQKFVAGQGTLLDLEYLLDERKMRLVSFSRYAGIAGAIAGLNALLPQSYPLMDQISSTEWKRQLSAHLPELKSFRYLITGAEGRCGGGVGSIFEDLGIRVDRWTLEDTLSGRPFSDILNYDVLFHCAAALTAQPLMVKLSEECPELIVDITCDIGNPFNLLDLGHHATSFAAPVQWIQRTNKPLKVVAIDHLPNLLSEESSRWFSSQLLPLLMKPEHPAWEESFNHFQRAIAHLGGAM